MSDGSAEDGSRGPEVDLRAYLYLALMVLIGSSTAPAARFAARELPPGLLPLLRFGVAGLCLLPLVWRRDGGLGLIKMVRADGGRLALAAALCVPVNQTFFLNSTRLTTTARLALILIARGAACGACCWPRPWGKSGWCRRGSWE